MIWAVLENPRELVTKSKTPLATHSHRVALIGAGNVSAVHLRGIGELDAAAIKVVGITDLDREKAVAVADKFGIPVIYPDVEAVLADDSVDIVAILVPPAGHKELALKALAAGKHVLCEKPMAESIEECQQMIEAAKQSSRRLFVVQNRIYTEAMQEARRIISSGGIGTVRLVKTAGIEGAELLDRMPSIRTDAFGVVSTAGVHQTYVIPWLIGQRITAVKAAMGRDPETDILANDGTAVIAVEYSGGAKHSMACTFEAGDRLTEHRLEVVGTGGRLRARREGDPANRREVLERLPRGQQQWQNVPLENPAVMGHEFGRMWEGITLAIDKGTEPELSLENAAHSVYVVHKIYEDATNRGTVIEAA